MDKKNEKKDLIIAAFRKVANDNIVYATQEVLGDRPDKPPSILSDIQFAFHDVVGIDGVIYPRDVLKKGVEDLIARGRPVYGYAYQPKDGQEHLTCGHVDLDYVSHKAENIRLTETGAICDIVILDTPRAVILKELLSKGAPINFRARSLIPGTISNGIVSEMGSVTIDAVNITNNG